MSSYCNRAADRPQQQKIDQLPPPPKTGIIKPTGNRLCTSNFPFCKFKHEPGRVCVQMSLNSSPAREIADSAPGTEGVKREIFYLNHENEMIRFLNEKDEESLMLNQPAAIEPRKQLSDFFPRAKLHGGVRCYCCYC